MSGRPVPVPPRYHVDSWVPEYGTSYEEEPLGATTEVDVGVEVPVGDWGPVGVDPALAVRGPVAFIDGVRRKDATLWISDPMGGAHSSRALLGSYAAGVVLTAQEGRARVVEVAVGRCLVTDDPDAEPIVARHGRWTPKVVADTQETTLSAGLQDRMTALEAELAGRWRGQAELCVNDGPLNRVGMPSGALGYVKTHDRRYLPDHLDAVVRDLQAGERTPLFRIAGMRRDLWAWYVRLPGPVPHSWASVVRCEVAAGPDGLDIWGAKAMADTATATLPRFASSPYRDPRAPANLVPVGGLEQVLRHRLGDRDLLVRSLIRATS